MSEWTLNQWEVIHDLLGRDRSLALVASLPTFPEDLAYRLQGYLEEALEDVAGRFDSRKPLKIGKYDLAALFRCEGLLLAPDEFAWTVPKIRGKVVDKALSLRLLRRNADIGPTDLAEMAIDALGAGEDGLAEFLETLSTVQEADLLASSADLLVKLMAQWPPLPREWIIRIESGSPVRLCDGRIILRGQFDLAVGFPGRNPAEVVIVEHKSSYEHPDHIEEVRLYALLEAIARRVPPWKVAVYYPDEGRFRQELVTEDTLMSAVRRVTDGARRIADLWGLTRAADLTPGSYCRFCGARSTCMVGQTWLERTDRE